MKRAGGLLGLVLLLKLVVVFQLRHHPLVQPDAGLDTTAYAELAERVIGGDWGLGPGLYYVSPLYIYFLAACRGLTGSYTAVRLIQIVLGTLAVGLIAATTRKWFGRRAAWIAGGLAAFTGLFTFYEALILQTSIDVFLTAAALFCLTLALKRQSTRWWLVTGLVFGIQTMNRPQIALSVAGVVVVMLACRRWRPAVILGAGLFIGISPAAIRNAVVSHQFSLLSSQGGLNFYIGNHAGANGFYQLVPGITPSIKGQQEDTRRVAEQALGRTLTDTETSNYFLDQALDWMRAHPGDAAFLMLRKFGWVFHAQHVALPYSYPFYQYDTPTWLRFYVIGPWLLIPLGLVGLVFGTRRTEFDVRRARLASRSSERSERSAQAGTDYLIWVSFVPCYAGAVALFLISERYRLPLLVPLVAGAGGAIDHFIIQQITARPVAPWPERSRRLAAPLATLIVLGVLLNTRTIANDGRFDEGVRLAHQLVVLGRFDEAESWVNRLEAAAPQTDMAAGPERSRRVHDSVGRQYLLAKQPARALPHLTQGLGASSSQEDWLLVGRLTAEFTTADAAEPFFRHAVGMNPNQPDARQQYGLNLLVLNRMNDAARELGEAVRLDPRNAASLSHLAYCEAKLGRIPDARRHVAAALAIDPSDAMALQLAAVLR